MKKLIGAMLVSSSLFVGFNAFADIYTDKTGTTSTTLPPAHYVYTASSSDSFKKEVKIVFDKNNASMLACVSPGTQIPISTTKLQGIGYKAGDTVKATIYQCADTTCSKTVLNSSDSFTIKALIPTVWTTSPNSYTFTLDKAYGAGC